MSSQREKKSFEYVKYLWQDEVADQLSGLDRLVYRSNKLGEDLTLTNTGGGNTSSKLIERDPLTGQEVEVLWVKGSGGDLRTAKRDGFASFYLDKIRAMKPLYLNDPNKWTVTVGLNGFLDTTGVSAFGPLFAMATVSIAPIVGFFLVSQRMLVEGVATTGIK